MIHLITCFGWAAWESEFWLGDAALNASPSSYLTHLERRFLKECPEVGGDEDCAHRKLLADELLYHDGLGPAGTSGNDLNPASHQLLNALHVDEGVLGELG